GEIGKPIVRMIVKLVGTFGAGGEENQISFCDLPEPIGLAEDGFAGNNQEKLLFRMVEMIGAGKLTGRDARDVPAELFGTHRAGERAWVGLVVEPWVVAFDLQLVEVDDVLPGHGGSPKGAELLAGRVPGLKAKMIPSAFATCAKGEVPKTKVAG